MTPPKPKSKPQKAAQAAEKLPPPEDRTAALARAAVLKGHDFNRAKQLTPSAPASDAEGRSSSPQTPNLPISAASLAPDANRPTPVPDQPSSTDSQLVAIDKPVYGGDFLARVDGKALFVPLTLPGEQALVRITHHKRGYATAEPGQILHPAPERIAPACPHFGVCGGCHYQHAGYATQLALKQSILRETLDRASVPIPAAIEILSANPWHYRNRIRLALDSAGNPGYRGRRSHAVIPIRECPIAAPLLLQAAQSFAAIARSVAPSFRPSELALFCDPAETALQASIFTTSAKNNNFDPLISAWRERIPALVSAELLLESRASKTSPSPRVIARWGAPSLTYRAANFDYRVDHGAFFQVNRWLVDALVSRVVSGQSGSLAWDLFAGVGLFARALTPAFTRVVAVESAPSATQALAANLKGTRGVPIRATTLDFLRRPLAPAARPDPVVPDLIVLDPPRTGLGPEITALLVQLAAPAVVYVSCDPATLARDLHALLAGGYQIQSIALADLFPQTFHLETVVHLRRS